MCEHLAAQISVQLAPDGSTNVLVLSPDLEQTISGSIQRREHGSLIALDAGTIARIVAAFRKAVEKVSVLHPDPAILCSPDIRPHVRKITERFRAAQWWVVSTNELSSTTQVDSIGTVQLGEASA